ncbi:MAG: hypothetical protein M3Y87_30260 [Myxococcota bacterium]|nr:hypothetical protein [Myxococcota bacterium]
MNLERTWRRATSAMIATLAIAAAGLVCIPQASAQEDEGLSVEVDPNMELGVEPPNFFVGGGLGGSLTITDNPGFKLEESFGYRFATISMGNALNAHIFGAGLLQQTFGPSAAYNFGARTGADFEVINTPGFALLITPMVSAGVAILNFEGQQRYGEGTEAALALEAAAQAEFVLMNGALGVWIRPVGVNYYVRDGAFVNYDMMIGVNARL